MTDSTDTGYDEATNTDDGRDTIPAATEIEPEAPGHEAVTDDNAFDDTHSVADMVNVVTPSLPDKDDINEHDNLAEWSQEK